LSAEPWLHFAGFREDTVRVEISHDPQAFEAGVSILRAAGKASSGHRAPARGDPMQRMEEAQRRQTIIVEATQQRRFVRQLMRMPIVMVLALSLVGIAAFAELSAPARSPELTWLLAVVSGLVLLTSLAVVWTAALRISHRVHGPEKRMIEVLAGIRRGELGQRVRLRDGDQLGELAEELNSLLAWLESHPPQARSGAAQELPSGNESLAPLERY
jgi:nitrogen fixation/metabolism regulation signal transduction histidine kinase